MPKFPLEDKFAPLRQELDRVRDAVIAFGRAIRSASGQQDPGDIPAGQRGGARSPVSGVASRAKQEATLAEKAMKRIDAATGYANKRIEAFNRGMQGAADVMRAAGFEMVAGKIDAVAVSITSVSHAINGLLVALPLIVPAALAVGALGVAFGALQEVIKYITGETLNFKEVTVAAFAVIAQYGVDAYELVAQAWQGLVPAIKVIFTSLQSTLMGAFRDILDYLAGQFMGLAKSILDIPAAVRAAIPGLNAVATAAAALGSTMKGMANDTNRQLGSVNSKLVDNAIAWNKSTQSTRESAAAWRQALDEMFTDQFDGKDAKRLFSGEFFSALGENADLIKKELKKAFKGGKEAIEEALPGLKDAHQTQSYANTAGQGTGQAWTSGVSEAIEGGSVDVNTAMISALTIDPKTGKVINSFRDLWKNIKDVFKENPLAFLGNIFGFAQGGIGGGQGGATGMARGGFVHGGGTPSLAHYANPRGYARGGRPSGLHPSDKHAVWLAYGEYVTRAAAVARPFALQALEAINAGRASTQALAAVAGAAPAHTTVQSGPGMAGGGMVTGRGSAGGGRPTPAYVVPSNANMQALATGGRDALLDWLRLEGPNVRSALGL